MASPGFGPESSDSASTAILAVQDSPAVGQVSSRPEPSTLARGFARANKALRAALNRVWLREILVLVAVYGGYEFIRARASGNLAAATSRALNIQTVEHHLRIADEHHVNRFFAHHWWVGLGSSYWYSAAYYIATTIVLVWLYRRRPGAYRRQRSTLLIATAIALVCYLMLPTAPPRMVGAYVDVLAQHANQGWWSSDASAPRGWASVANQLAAFPSMHAGWALWVALALKSARAPRPAQAAGWAYAAITAIVVVGTANHWVIDVLAGWLVVSLTHVGVMLFARRRLARARSSDPT